MSSIADTKLGRPLDRSFLCCTYEGKDSDENHCDRDTLTDRIMSCTQWYQSLLASHQGYINLDGKSWASRSQWYKSLVNAVNDQWIIARLWCEESVSLTTFFTVMESAVSLADHSSGEMTASYGYIIKKSGKRISTRTVRRCFKVAQAMGVMHQIAPAISPSENTPGVGARYKFVCIPGVTTMWGHEIIVPTRDEAQSLLGWGEMIRDEEKKTFSKIGRLVEASRDAHNFLSPLLDFFLSSRKNTTHTQEDFGEIPDESGIEFSLKKKKNIFLWTHRWHKPFQLVKVLRRYKKKLPSWLVPTYYRAQINSCTGWSAEDFFTMLELFPGKHRPWQEPYNPGHYLWWAIKKAKELSLPPAAAKEHQKQEREFYAMEKRAWQDLEIAAREGTPWREAVKDVPEHMIAQAKNWYHDHLLVTPSPPETHEVEIKYFRKSQQKVG